MLRAHVTACMNDIIDNMLVDYTPGNTGGLHLRATGLVHFVTWTIVFYGKMKRE